MPRMNGYDAARILKGELHITCPILAVTATSDNTDMLEANSEIIDGYLLKPYNPGVFKELFRREQEGKTNGNFYPGADRAPEPS